MLTQCKCMVSNYYCVNFKLPQYKNVVAEIDFG